MPTPPGQPVVQLRIELADIDPPVWRRLLVPGSVRLDKLHRMIQAAMGWEDCHLHSFSVGDARYGMQFDDYPEDELDEKSVSVVGAIREAKSFTYEYDFGDGWEHEILVEARWTMPIGLKFAVCLDGQNACPPEDSGGPGGYAMLLEALADSSHDEHEELLRWAGGAIDPTEFDLALANARLQAVR